MMCVMMHPMLMSSCLAAFALLAFGATKEEPTPLISLADSLKPLQDRFNAEKDKPRFVALLSPT